MEKIKIHALRCGQVRTTKYLPFNPDNKPLMTVAGVFVPQKDWAWSPVYCYYIEHPKGKILIDTAWSRRMSPEGAEDKKAEIREHDRIVGKSIDKIIRGTVKIMFDRK